MLPVLSDFMLIRCQREGPGANGQSSALSEKKNGERSKISVVAFQMRAICSSHQRDTAFLFDFISYKCQRGNNVPDSCMANCWALISLPEQGVQLKSFHSGSFQRPWCSECLTADANLKNMRFLFRCISQRSKGVVGNGTRVCISVIGGKIIICP